MRKIAIVLAAIGIGVASALPVAGLSTEVGERIGRIIDRSIGKAREPNRPRTLRQIASNAWNVLNRDRTLRLYRSASLNRKCRSGSAADRSAVHSSAD
jgi:hypothetical protein